MNKKFIAMGLVLISTFSVTGAYCYTKAYSEKINVVSYKEPEKINESGYQITKYEDVDAYDWIDDDNVLVLKDNGVYHNYDSDIPMSSISVYNLDTKTYKDYSDITMSSHSFYGVSPSGRYVLYGEPRYIPKIESEEWKKAADSQELFHEKHDILDLTTGEIIEDFDKTINNCDADYRWISDDKIFVKYDKEWRIINKEGKKLKQGTFNFDNPDSSCSNIIGIGDVIDLGDDCNGKFYYDESFTGSDGNSGINIYSMDINSLKEELISKCEHSLNSEKKGKNIAVENFNNNGETNEEGVYEHRTFGFNIVNEKGNGIQKIELPEGRFTDLIKMSPDGTKGVFLDQINLTTENSNTADVSNDCIKLLNISSGNVKEIGKISNLIDENRDENFYDVSAYAVEGIPTIKKVPGPRFGRIAWDKKGTSLFYTYKYTSKEDGKNHTDTYIITFDNN